MAASRARATCGRRSLGIRRLDPPELHRTISVAYRPGSSPAADTLRALLRGAFTRNASAP